MRRLLAATAVGQAVIVVTGGVVRIAGAGLGCPTWPRCTTNSLVPADADLVMWIEFGNRLVATGLGVLCVWSLIALIRTRAGRLSIAMAVAQVVGVTVQAVIGGVGVLTGLEPVVIAVHLGISTALVYLSVAIWSRHTSTLAWSTPAAATATTAMVLAGLLVVATGSVVTASGPYAGDSAAPRLQLDTYMTARLHGTAAITLFLATATTGLIFARAGAPGRLRGTAVAVLAVLVAQLGVGSIQLLTDRPPLLVVTHLLLATTLIAIVSYLHVGTRSFARTGVTG